MKEFKKKLFYSITVLGISSIITQIVVLREFLSVFQGNELVFGIILANWLLLTGFGSYIGKYTDKIKFKLRWWIIAQLIIAFLPFFHIIIIRNLRNLFFLYGELIDLISIILSTFLILLPYCFISGFLLTLACCIWPRNHEAKSIGIVYFIDNIGDILGGFIFTYILIFFLNHFQMLILVMALNLVGALILSHHLKAKFLWWLSLILLTTSLLIFSFVDLNKITIQQQYKNQQLIYQKESQYGNIVITKSGNQLNFFENGVILFTTENTIANEETVHYSMVQHSNPRSILLISGGIAGTIKEILKYNVTKIDYVELDPLIIEIGKRFTNLSQVKVHTIDGRLFIKQAKQKYDVIIIDLPSPSNAQLNRFYTLEFFNELKRIMKEDSILSLSLSSSENYMNKEIVKLNSVIYATLKNVFKHVIIIPGDKNYFIASDHTLTYKIADLIEKRDINTSYVNKYYLKGKITPDRINYIFSSLEPKVRLNQDFNPLSYYYYLLFWVSHFRVNYSWLIILGLILLVIYLTRLKPISFSIFTTGFAGSSLEIILLIGFQIIYGYVYNKIGLIITAFMLGLAIGSHIMNKTLTKRTIKDMVRIEFLIFIFSITLPLILILLNKIRYPTFLIPLLTLTIAIFVGMEFPLAAKLSFKSISTTAATLYSADLIGACVGAFIVSTFLLPLLGIIKVSILIGLLNLLSGLILRFKQPFGKLN